MAEAERLKNERRAAEAAEKEKQEAEAEEARQLALRPEKDQLIDWLKKLRFIDGVEINDSALAQIQAEVLGELSVLSETSVKRVEVL